MIMSIPRTLPLSLGSRLALALAPLFLAMALGCAGGGAQDKARAAAPPEPVRKLVAVHMDDSGVPGIPSYDLNISYLDQNPIGRPVILFIHGNSASKECFEPLLAQPPLRPFRLIVVDLPGHGESDWFPPALRNHFQGDEYRIFQENRHYYTYPGYAHTLLRFLGALDIRPEDTCLLGWGLGGNIAMDMVAEQPRLHGAILMGTPILPMTRFMEAFQGPGRLPDPGPFPAGTTFRDLQGWRRPFDAGEARAFHALAGIPPSVVTEAAGAATDPEARYFMVKFASEAAAHAGALGGYQDPEATVRRYPEKFAVLQGTGDPACIQGREKGRVMAMGVRFGEIEGAGPAAFVDAPDQAARFISRHFWPAPAPQPQRPVPHRFHGNPPPPHPRRHPHPRGPHPQAPRHLRPSPPAPPQPRPFRRPQPAPRPQDPRRPHRAPGRPRPGQRPARNPSPAYPLLIFPVP